MSKQKYDPYIHGTTSKTLSLMSQTDFQLMPILWMIDEYYKAPMVGELVRGAYSVVGKKIARKEHIGAISFGNAYSGGYSLSTVTREYTGFTPPDKNEVLSDFNSQLELSFKSGFSNINLLIIYLTRGRSLHNNLNEIISPETLKGVNQQLDALVQFYYLVQLLGSHIFPDFKKIEQIGNKNPILTKSLRLEEIVKRIIESKINVKEILANPTADNLHQALTLLELSEQATKVNNLSYSQLFCLDKPENESEFDCYEDENCSYFFKNVSGYGIELILNKFISSKYVGPKYFQGLSKDIEKHILTFEDRIRLFRKIIAAPQERFNFKDESLISGTNFPVVLVSESEKIKHHSESEYRSTKPLKLGEDIRLVATDTKSHKHELKQYFWANKINPVQVVLLDELEIARDRKSVLPLSIDTQALRVMLTKTKSKESNALFYELYTLIDELNEKRNEYRESKNQKYRAHDLLLKTIESEMENAFKTATTLATKDLQEFCFNCALAIQDQRSILEQHQGIIGVIDMLLTILVSMIVFYPIVYAYQKYNDIPYTFFNTASGKLAQRAHATLEKISETLNDEDSSEEVSNLEFLEEDHFSIEAWDEKNYSI